jgi:hypothetical protein
VDACISVHIKLEHVITCTFGCTNGEMHVESFSDAVGSPVDSPNGSPCLLYSINRFIGSSVNELPLEPFCGQV